MSSDYWRGTVNWSTDCLTQQKLMRIDKNTPDFSENCKRTKIPLYSSSPFLHILQSLPPPKLKKKNLPVLKLSSSSISSTTTNCINLFHHHQYKQEINYQKNTKPIRLKDQEQKQQEQQPITKPDQTSDRKPSMPPSYLLRSWFRIQSLPSLRRWQPLLPSPASFRFLKLELESRQSLFFTRSRPSCFCLFFFLFLVSIPWINTHLILISVFMSTPIWFSRKRKKEKEESLCHIPYPFCLFLTWITGTK